MTKKFRAVKVSMIMLILLISVIISIVPSTSAVDKILTFNSVLEMTYDQEYLNQAVQPDGPAVTIPVTIKYKVEVPENVLKYTALRMLFFQTFIVTAVKVKMEILNEPDWASVSLVNPNPYIDIDTEFTETTTAVVIAPYKDAPARPFTLRIKAETDPVLNNHVPANSAELNMVFTPGYIPLINVYTEQPARVVEPQTTVSFPIKITNLGNKETIVTVKVTDYPSGWAPLLAQSQIVIPAAGETSGDNIAELSFSITPPYGLGWHNELETITLEFTPQFSPPGGGGNQSGLIGTPVPFQLSVRNRGFSTPGFELFGVLGALIITMIVIKKRKHT